MVSTEATPFRMSKIGIHNSPPSIEEGKPGMGEHRQPRKFNRRTVVADANVSVHPQSMQCSPKPFRLS
jgi:hypothetical protein